MDFIILIAVSQLIHSGKQIGRLLLGSVIGATAACLMVILHDINPWIRFVLSYLVTSVIMIIVSFGYTTIKRLLQSLFYLFAVTIFLGGLLTFVFFNTSVTEYMEGLLGLKEGQTVGLLMLIIAFSILLICMPYVVHYMNAFRKRTSNIFDVSLQLDEKTITIKALLDTGNHLRDPISKKPVVIVEREAMEKLLTKELTEYTTRLKIIPFRSIGKEHGTMFGVMIDCMTVSINDQQHQHKNVIACLYEGTLSSKKEYQLILHEELL